MCSIETINNTIFCILKDIMLLMCSIETLKSFYFEIGKVFLINSVGLANLYIPFA